MIVLKMIVISSSKRWFSKNLFSKVKISKVYMHVGRLLRKDKGPLDGIRICDMTRVLAGPYATMVLGDMGAEVIKIEKPGVGDDTRSWGPPFVFDDQAYYFLSINRNKKSVSLDITKSKGKDIIHEIAKKSDVFIENFVPGKLDSLGLGYKDLKQINPQIIYCALTGFGPRGPDKNKPGYDLIASAIGGGLHITGDEDGRPNRIGIATTDIITGMFAHSAIIAALYERKRTMKGKKIDVSLLQSQIAMLHSVGTNYLNTGLDAKRLGTAHPSIAPYQAFKGSDGEFVIAAGNEKHFKNLALAMEMPELLTDDRFTNNPQRVNNRKVLSKLLQDRLIEKSRHYWINLFEDFGIPCGSVKNLKETFDAESTVNFVQELHHPVYGNIKIPGPAVEYNGSNHFFEASPPPLLGEHTVEVLRDILNFSDTEINKLCENKVIEVL